jgi:hypothetical protein
MSRINTETPRPISEAEVWNDLLDSHQSVLLAAINSLISCDCSDSIMQELHKKLELFDVPEAFRLRFALRTAVKSTIAHVEQCDRARTEAAHDSNDRSDASLVRSLPLPERFVYFLIDRLSYSRREVSLLVGVSDLQIERSLAQARKHISTVLEVERENRWADNENIAFNKI